jgi:small subunit ribosomal protein S6
MQYTVKHMRLYELVMVMRPSLSESERKKLIDSVKGWLEDVKVTKEEEWGQKPLAYKIKKEIAGVYHLMNLETENSIPLDFERRVLHTDEIIRHLLVRTK